MPGVDLATGWPWLVFALALALLPPLTSRPVVFWRAAAAIDLAFVAAVLSSRLSGDATLLAIDFGAFVLLPLGLFWLVVRALEDTTRGRMAVAVGAGGASLLLFFVHKRPDLVGSTLGDLPPVLGVVGFSYVALRALDLLRAVAQRRAAAPSLARLVAYLVPLHMLAAGPIQGAEEFDRQTPTPPPDFAGALAGAERIVGGLFKKYVLAQALQTTLLTGFSAGGLYFWIEVQLFFIWVWLDFSALADIAVGMGQLLGRPAPENFRRPLTARNLIVFWERWHITLSEFARRNLFVPIQLTLMRREGARPLVAGTIGFLATFVAIGAWHALSWGFVAWGAMHAAGVAVTNLYRAALLRRLGRKGVKRYQRSRAVRVVSTILTFEYVALSLMLVERYWRGS